MRSTISLLWFVSAGCAAGSSPPQTVQASFAEPAGFVGQVLARRGDLIFAVDDEPKEKEAFRKRTQDTAAQLQGMVVSETPEALVVSVPEPRFDEAMDRLGAVGDLKRREVTTTDHTLESVDLDARIESQSRLRERLQALLERAASVEDVLKIETELGRVTSELESLRARKRALDSITQLSQIQLHLEPDRTPGPVGWVFYGLYHSVKWLFVWD